jgi:hypothetical protein
VAHVITFALGFMFKLILIINNHNLHAQLVVFIGTHDNFMHMKRFYIWKDGIFSLNLHGTNGPLTQTPRQRWNLSRRV